MTVTKQQNGSILITDIVKNQLFKQVYYGYSLSKAKADFKKLLKAEKAR